MLRTYYHLSKPGIVYGNALTTLAAFLFASKWHFNVASFLLTIVGICFVIASACIWNNYFDREIDARMTRTKARAFATGTVGVHGALAFGSALGVIGLILLAYVNVLTALVALGGFISYVFLYTFSKRLSPLGTLVGSISGAVPVVVGYTAAAGRLDTIAVVLFFILVAWQMPHFYAIALRRLHEYRAAGIPILPLVYGARRTKFSIVFYIIAYVIAACALAGMGVASHTYALLVLISGTAWLVAALAGFAKRDDEAWAKRLFLWSLAVLLIFCAALALSPLTP